MVAILCEMDDVSFPAIIDEQREREGPTGGDGPKATARRPT